MGRLMAIAGKDLRLLLRDRGGAFFTFVFPVIMAVFFGTVFSSNVSRPGDSGGAGGSGGITVLMVNQDQGAAAEAWSAALADLSLLTLEEAPDLPTAQEALRRGSAQAYIEIPPGFSAADADLLDPQIPQLKMVTDPRRTTERAILEGLLMQLASERLQTRLTDPAAWQAQLDTALDRAVAAGDSAQYQALSAMQDYLTGIQGGTGQAMPGLQPLQLQSTTYQPPAATGVQTRSRPLSAYDISFPQGIIWGFLGCLSTFAVSLVTERRRGTLLRLTISPTPRWHILLGKTLACFIAVSLVAGFLLLLGYLVFDLTVGSPLLLLLAIVASGICFSGLMMGLSVLGRTERTASGYGWVVLMPMAMAGGGMIPLSVMPSWLTAVSHFSPVKWSILAMEGALWRGFSLMEMLPSVAILLTVGVVIFALGATLFRWQED